MSIDENVTASTVECDEHQRPRDVNCMLCSAREHMLFADVDVQSAQGMLKPVKQIFCAGNTIIYREGETPGALYSIRRGIVKLSMSSEGGDTISGMYSSSEKEMRSKP